MRARSSQGLIVEFQHRPGRDAAPYQAQGISLPIGKAGVEDTDASAVRVEHFGMRQDGANLVAECLGVTFHHGTERCVDQGKPEFENLELTVRDIEGRQEHRIGHPVTNPPFAANRDARPNQRLNIAIDCPQRNLHPAGDFFASVEFSIAEDLNDIE